jgi:hypothetical protein
MAWNHRVLAFKQDDGDLYLRIHEVYYDDNKQPNGYTANPVSLGCEDLSGLSWTLNKMKECLKKPVLWSGSDFPKVCAITYTCLHCGRDKFTKKQPHNCTTGFRKRKLAWSLQGS